jgi:hypothetical protein
VLRLEIVTARSEPRAAFTEERLHGKLSLSLEFVLE